MTSERGAMCHDPTTTDDAPGGIQSLDAALRVLKALSAQPHATGVSELARTCGMPVSKVHRYLSSFAHAGLVQQNGRSGTYDLGPAARELGLAAIARNDIVNATGDHLAELPRRTGLTALLAVWSEAGPTVVRWERAASPIVTSFGLGTTLPLLSSATGRAFLAFLPRHLTDALAAVELDRMTHNAALLADLRADDRDRLSDLVSGIRATGTASVDGRYIPGLAALAAPVLNWQGEAEAVVTLIGTDPAMLEAESQATGALRDFCRQHGVQRST